ncbi:HlyC/CorC family transporter [Geminicoccaceae bacterium 1502E]|nr:HlyC/CorC family transporter [Geminicoccaceae bacterium 1502E]
MLELLPSLAAIAGLLVLSGLASGTETAMTGASREQIHHLAGEGNKRARLVERLMGDKERLIGALLIGNNIVNILAAALATELFLRVTGEAGVAYATLVMTVLVVIFGEVLPKTYAIRHSERFAMAVAPGVRALVLVLSPLTAMVRFVVNLMLRIFGTSLEGGSLVPMVDRLRGAINFYAAEGGMKKLERDMLGAVLDLQEVEVGMVMTHRSKMTTIDADMPLHDMVRFVRGAPYTRYPVWRGDADQVIGFLHAKDLLSLVDEQGNLPETTDLKKLLTPPWFIPDTTSLYQQLLAFRQKRQHLALVVDEYGTIMGLVTLEDVIEEIVGDIADEKDVEVSGIESLPDGSVVVDGRVALRDLNRRFDWRLPDEEVATIAGLVMHVSRRIPKEGESVDIEGHRIEVVRRQRHHLQRLRITTVQSEP